MKIVKKNKTYFINIEKQNEEVVLESFLNRSLDITKDNNVLLLSIKKTNANSTTKQKIISLLEDDTLTFKDKVEGTFEKLLNKEDLQVFKKMIVDKEIEIFKLSSKYKKGVYQISGTKNFKNNYFSNKNNKNSSKKESDIFSIFKNNKYIILQDLNFAKKFSQEFENLIKSGEIIGIKSFDGNYYIIYKSLFLNIKDQIYALKLKDSFTIDFLISKMNFSKDVLKIVIEILKDKGEIFESKKDIYNFLNNKW